ncbi:hypothetical protein DV737_g499, partial [Chaetothyriales sp. CBS 132003]
MSAILSSDDLNDFISPGVACIKPVETLPADNDQNPYEVTTEYQVAAQNPAPASISLTDCLACSGCVTSAEAVLVSLQSHNEVLNTLDAHPNLDVGHLVDVQNGLPNGYYTPPPEAKIFVASVSPQVRASIATTYGISDVKAGYMIDQLLSGPRGLRSGGQKLSGFQYVVDTNRLRDVCHVLGAAEVETALQQRPSSRQTLPILASACPGWICYAEKTHPHILPHLSSLKSAQALSGTLLKSVICKALGVQPSQVWHLAIMPCFDKKLEASRAELTNEWWQPPSLHTPSTSPPVRDVDCVITSRELLSLASARDIQLSTLPLEPVSHPPFPVPGIAQYLFPPPGRRNHSSPRPEAGTSDGYLYYILKSQQAAHPNSQITIQRGRNADVVEYTLRSASGQSIMTCARYYGFRNIQNLVRKLKPARQSKLPGAARRMQKDSGTDYAYVEVMACPGGCTNGGGQIKVDDVAQTLVDEGADEAMVREGPQAQKEWLRRVDEAYFSADDDDDSGAEAGDANGGDTVMTNGHDDHDIHDETEMISNVNIKRVHELLRNWEAYVGVPREKLAYTTFRAVDSDVGKTKKTKVKEMTDTQRIANIAGMSGGGW